MGLRVSHFPSASPLDGTELMGLVQNGATVKAPINDIAIIAKGPPGSAGEGYPTRVALSDVIATDRDDAYLAEPGREGKFVFDSSNFVTKLGAPLTTVDPQQGIYVAPASDTTGASGAWVRRFFGPVNPCWFGVLTSNSAAANTSAFTAALAALKATAVLSAPFATLGHVQFPDAGTYNFDTVDFNTGSVRVSGCGPANFNTGTTIKTATGVTAFRFQSTNTSGASSPTGGTGFADDDCIVDDLRFDGAYAGTEAEAHGVHIRSGKVRVSRCVFTNYEGDGIHASANVADGGNACAFEFSGNIFYNNRNNIYVSGDNANAGSGRDNNTSNARQWGLIDDSFLGNMWHGVAEACGTLAGTYTPCNVSYNGNWYACVAGQEVGASTNAPSGTTADNTWWYYIQAGAPSTVSNNVPAWVSGTTYRAGGPIRTTGVNAHTVIIGHYCEVSQGPCQLTCPTLVLGGDMLSGVKGVPTFRNTAEGIQVLLNSPGVEFGVGIPGDGYNFFRMVQGVGQVLRGAGLNFQDAALTSTWLIQNAGGNLQVFTGANASATFYSAGALTFSYDSTGLDLASGKTLQVNGTQVITSRQTGTPADATDLATALTLVNALKAKLITHGLIS